MVIGICGKAHVGKSWLASSIKNYIESKDAQQVEIIPFAKQLKNYATEMGWNGQKDIKGRRLLQLLGTEIGRDCLGYDYWVHQWYNQVAEHFHNGITIIADDVRFVNEATAIHMLGGRIVQVTGQRRNKISTITRFRNLFHRSERGLPSKSIDTTYFNKDNLGEYFREWFEDFRSTF
jgi:hypothetical protein